jgi:anti-sigma regulatory factor (Ser/Thr protein kinase)
VNAQSLPTGPATVTPLPQRIALTEELRVVRIATADSLAGLRAVVSTWGRGADLPADVLVDLLLAVGEATANVVDHAYRGAVPGPMEVELQLRRRRAGRAVTARIRDRGSWRSPDPSAADRGRGLPMIRALADHCVVSTTAQGTEVCLEIAAS